MELNASSNTALGRAEAWVLIHVPSGYQMPGAFPTEVSAKLGAAELSQKTGDAFIHIQRLVPKTGYWPLSEAAPPALQNLLWGKC